MASKDQLKSLLGNGVPAAQAAKAVGCSAAYVAELMAEAGFSEEVATMRVGKLHAATERDAKYDAIEDKLLGNLETMAPLMLQPAMLLKAITVVNGAKRRGVTDAETVAAQKATVVVLHLPEVLRHRYKLNPNNEIIEVDGRTLLTIDSNAILANLEGAKNVSTANTSLAIAEI